MKDLGSFDDDKKKKPKKSPEGVVLKKDAIEKEKLEAEAKGYKKALLMDSSGNPILDDDGKEQELASGAQRGIGYVNGNGVLFPVGYKVKVGGRIAGHIGWRGNIVLKQCPKCNYLPMSDEAVLGNCANSKGPPDGKTDCGFSLVAEVEAIEL